MSSYHIIELGPGSVVSCDGARATTFGIVLSMWYEMPPDRAPKHLVAWNDGRVTLSNFGLTPVGGSRRFSSSLKVVIDQAGKMDGQRV